jgi:hypothetical protein
MKDSASTIERNGMINFLALEKNEKLEANINKV